LENLVWLCLEHHDEFDSHTSQSKGLTPEEVRAYRDRLYKDLGTSEYDTLAPSAQSAVARVDVIVAIAPEALTRQDRLRLVSIIAAYLGLPRSAVSVVTVTSANSTRVRLELPALAAQRLLEGFHAQDETLHALLEDFQLLRVESPSPTPSSEQVPYTIDPLVDRGRDALAPDLALGIREVVVQEVGIGWDNVYQEVVIRRGSDVFQSAKAGGSVWGPLPRGARVLFAVLRFDVVGAGRPCLAEIWPPHILTIAPAHAAPVIERWLEARGFCSRTQPGLAMVETT
jgi:hypothetical protein